MIDYPGEVAATIFLFGCNFRCGFCHNPELVVPEKLVGEKTEKEVLDFLEKRKKYLDGVCITGGEPLMNEGLDLFLRKVKDLGYKIKVDTNGSFPENLKKLIEKDLVDFIAMDIKADKENYDLLTGVESNLEDIEKSIKLIIDSGKDYEFRTTVVPGKHDGKVIENMGKWLSEFNGNELKKFSIQNFVPRKGKMVDDDYEKVKSFEKQDLDKFKEILDNYFEKVGIRE